MAHPQVVNVGYGFQMWRVAVNTLNKQSRTAGRGWLSSLEVGLGANNCVTKCYTELRTCTDSLEWPQQRKWNGGSCI